MRPLIPLLAALAACKASPTPIDTDPIDVPTDPVVEPDLIGFVVHPARPLVQVGQTVQLRAQARWSDGTFTDVTGDVAWASTNGAFAAIDAGGLVTAATAGDVDLSGTFDGRTLLAPAHVYALGVTVSAVQVHPAASTVPAGTSLWLSAFAELTDGFTGDMSPNCTWTSSDASIATVGAAGALQTLVPGQVTIDASCPDGSGGSSLITVEPADAIVVAPALGVLAYQASVVGPGRVRHTLDVQNAGGQSQAFEVGFTLDAAQAPTSDDARVGVVGVGPGATTRIEVDLLFEGARPASVTPWVRVDPDEQVPDADRSDNLGGGVPIELPGDLLADLEVDFQEALVFGPQDAGVVIAVTNHGPEPVTDVVLWFERHEPGASTITDVSPSTAERSEPIPSIAVGDTYTWVFTYDQVPFDNPWWSCGFVVLGPVADPNLVNNISCIEFQEY